MTLKEVSVLEPEVVYTTNPEISFEGKSFCLTGLFDGYQRSDLERCVEGNGGVFTANVSEGTDYLVIGSKGTRCCSFACCTRVVEKAVELKEDGAALLFIKESDFIRLLGRVDSLPEQVL